MLDHNSSGPIARAPFRQPGRGASLHSARALLGIALAVVAIAVLSFSSVVDRPSTSAAAVSQPQTPITAAFFYSWYPSHWTENGIYPYTNFTPSLGYYSSMDSAVITQQLSLARQAHLDAFISSWWEPGETTDVALQQILDITEQIGSAIRWSTYYEGEAYGDPTPAQIADNLQYMETNLFSSPAYLRVDNKPVVFVYASANDGCVMADRWAQAQTIAGIDVYVVLKVFYGYATCTNQPESWHQYSPTSAFEYHGPFSVSVSPGFAKVGEPTALKRSLAGFEAGVQWMVLANVNWRLITTWNEWPEGTSIEPATQYGNAYIDILCRNLPGTASCASPVTTPTPGPTPAPTPTPTPTSTRTPAPTSAPTPTPTPAPTSALTLTPTPTPTPTASPPPTTTSTAQPPTATPTVTPTPTPTPRPPKRHSPRLFGGDGDCDGDTDAVDALNILRVVAGLAASGNELCRDIGAKVTSSPGDVDCDSDVDAVDALQVLRFVAGFPASQNEPCPPIGELPE